jgi:rubrerythrin
MKSLKILSKRSYTIGITAILLIIISPLFSTFALGAAGDVWNKSGLYRAETGFIDLEGYRYSERIQIYIDNSSMIKTNVPIKITPWFPQGRCAQNSIRILQNTNEGDKIELPYIILNKTNYEFTQYLAYAAIVFVAPQLPGFYELIYSYNTTIPARAFNPTDYLTVYNNELSDFYDISENSFNKSLDFNFDGSGNQTGHILIKDAGTNMFLNITSGSFKAKLESRFHVIETIEAPGGASPGMGPASVRFYNGSIFGKDNYTYLLIGWPDSISVYCYNLTNWTQLFNLPIPNDPITGNKALVSGMTISNITGALDYAQLIFGTKNGTVYIYNMNATDLGPFIGTFNVTSNGIYQKPYGITTVNINYLYRPGQDPLQDLVIAGSGKVGSSSGRVQSYLLNNSEFIYDAPFPSTLYDMNLGYHPTSNNYSIQLYSQKNHQANEFENFFACNYRSTIVPEIYHDPQEFMAVGLDNTGALGVGIYHIVRFDQYTNNYVTLHSRLRTDGNYFKLPITGGGTVAYSTKFLNSQPEYSLIAAGYNDVNKRIVFYQYKLNSVNALTSPGVGYNYDNNGFDQGYLYPEKIQEFYGLNPYSSSPATVMMASTMGKITGQGSYDDAFFVDNYGYYYLLTFDQTQNKMILQKQGLLFDQEMDLYGTGQSVDSFDYNLDGKASLVVGDNNGFVRLLNYSIVQNVNFWVNNSNAIINIGSFPDEILYNQNIKQSTNFGIYFNDSIGINAMILPGQKFWYLTLDIGAGSASNIQILNLSVKYDTNNYSHIDPNLFTLGSFDYTLSSLFREFADFDGDGLSDFHESQNITYWNPADTIWGSNTLNDPIWGSNGPFITRNKYRMLAINRDYPVFTGNRISTTIRFNQTFTGFILDPFNNDTDRDGLLDGYEILIFGTNPSKNDTDGDGLNLGLWGTDYDEIYNTTYFFNATNSDTDRDGLNDLAEWGYGSDPNNINTDGDSVTFYYAAEDKYITYFLSDFDKVLLSIPGFDENGMPNLSGLNPCIPDTDGDGLSDLQELGLWDPGNKKSILSNVLKSENRGIQYYAYNSTFVNFYYPQYTNNLVQGLNPRLKDTDFDGLNDFQEIFGITLSGNTYYSDPTMNDTDKDKLFDGVELFGWDLNSSTGGVNVNYTYTNFLGHLESVKFFIILDPDNPDSDNDGLKDGEEVLDHKTNPINPDTDGDYLYDGEEIKGLTRGTPKGPAGRYFSPTNPLHADTDGDGLADGEEVYGIFFNPSLIEITNREFYYFIVITFNPDLIDLFGSAEAYEAFSDPTKPDSDGDGLTDYEEVILYFTNPMSKDTDGDGINDNLDKWPVLHNGVSYTFIVIMIFGGVGAVVAVPLNKYSATKALARKYLYKEKITRSTNRMDRERKESRAFSVRANSIPTEDPTKFKVKITMEIKDSAFFGRAARVSYSAGTKEFILIDAEKIEQEKYVFTLENIPVDTRVMYFVEFLDKGGIWVRDDNEEKFYTFATNKDGTIDTSDEDEWKVDHGIKCTVCGYLCQRTWDECPECGTKLFDDPSLSLVEDDQKKKEEALKREKDAEAIAWEEAQKTDEVWRGLPPCPQCGIAVQPEWAACPVCQFDLTTAKLKKEATYAWEEIDADYLEGKEEEEIKTDYEDDVEKVKSQKEILDELDEQERKKKQNAWQNFDNEGDVL